MTEKRRLMWHIYPSYLLIILISLVAVTWFASVSARQFFLSESESELETRAILFEKQFLEYLELRDDNKIDALCKEVGQLSSTRVTVILTSGKVIGDSESDPRIMDNHADRPEFIGAVTGGLKSSVRYSQTHETNFMYFGMPVRKDNELLAIIRTSIPIDIIDQEINKIQWKIMYGGMLIALLAAIVSLIVSRRISSPIENLKKGAESFIRGNFQYRMSFSNIEEIASLYDAMKDMAQQLHTRIKMITQQRMEIEAILASMVEGVIAVDNKERIIIMNNAAAKMFGCDFSRVQGLKIREVIKNIHFQQFVSETFSGKDSFEKEKGIPTDEERYLSAHGTLTRNIEGKRIGALFVLNDITRVRRLENIRKDFVANVSHEIKTPITAIKGFVEVLRDDGEKDDQDVRRFLDIIFKHVNRLEAIIDDLLKLSEIEKDAENEGIQLSESDINHVIESAVQTCKPSADSKGIEITLSCHEGLSARINPLLFEQAVVNLLDNAIKYSDENRPVTLEALNSEKEVIINVIDNGKGIEQEYLPRLFERFYRVDKARSRNLGGTGLGLAIVKHIIQAHGGHLSVISSPGKGSTFTIYLPNL